jgi:hypothetical protein
VWNIYMEIDSNYVLSIPVIDESFCCFNVRHGSYVCAYFGLILVRICRIKVNMLPPGARSPDSPTSGPTPMVSPGFGSNLGSIPASLASSAPNSHNVTPANSASPWISPSLSPVSVSLAPNSKTGSQRHKTS